MADTLRLAANKPEVIALAFTSGKTVTSTLNGEEQVMYTLMGSGARLYVDPPVARKIDSLNLGKGEPFEITKCVDRAKNTSYEVRYLDGANAPAPQAPAVTEFMRQPAPQAPVRQRVEAPANGTAAQVAQVPAQNSAPSPHTTGGKLMACLLVAVDSLVEVQAYALRKGLHVSFSAEDVRAVGNTLFINDAKGGR